MVDVITRFKCVRKFRFCVWVISTLLLSQYSIMGMGFSVTFTIVEQLRLIACIISSYTHHNVGCFERCHLHVL